MVAPQPSQETLGIGYKIGLGVAGAVYALLAAIGAIANASAASTPSSADMSASFVGGQIAGYFVCCASVPLVMASILAGLMTLANKKTSWTVLLAKVLFWVLLVLIPFQLLTLVMTLVRSLGQAGISTPSPG